MFAGASLRLRWCGLQTGGLELKESEAQALSRPASVRARTKIWVNMARLRRPVLVLRSEG